MERLIVEIESPAKAKELMSMLSALNFVKRVSALDKDATVPGSTSAVLAHIKEGLEEGREILSGTKKTLTHEQLKAYLKGD